MTVLQIIHSPNAPGPGPAQRPQWTGEAAMPYIIETRIDDPRQRLCGCGAHHDSCDAGGARTAVATLDKAREAVKREACQDHGWKPQDVRYHLACEGIAALPEDGGTVGPLPDGTVIEVREMSYEDIAGIPDGEELLADGDSGEIVAAFNAA